MIKLILAVVIGAVVVVVVMQNVSTSTESSSTEETTTEKITVSISGEVNKIGTYYVETGATLSDLIAAANDVTSNADSNAYNLDYILKDNQSFYIAPIYKTGETCSQVPITKVNVNTATQEELVTINGISTSLATNIISYRTNTGQFERLEDLMEVKSIGNAVFTKMRDYCTLK